MKKKILALVLVSGLTAASVASANWGRGGGYGMNYPNCPQFNGAVQQQIEPAVQEKLDKFFDDTQALRKEIAVKQAEKMALMRNDNPDPGAVAKLTGELFDLRASMRLKAEEAGVDQYIGPRGMMGGGFGPGMGGGPRGGGFKRGGGMGGGWN